MSGSLVWANDLFRVKIADLKLPCIFVKKPFFKVTDRFLETSTGECANW